MPDCIGAAGLITKFKRHPRRNGRRRRLQRHQILYNHKHEWVRNRVENVVAFVKRHKIFSTNFRQSHDVLSNLLKIVGHVSAFQLRRFQHFQSYGPWRHY